MTKENQTNVDLHQLKKEMLEVSIVGTTSLLMEAQDKFAAENIERKKTKKVPIEDKRTDEEKYEDKKWKTQDGKAGILSSAFHKGMIAVAPYIDGLDMKRVRGSVRVIGDVIPITYKKELTNVKFGKDSGMTKAPRKIVRPEYTDWSCKLKIVYNSTNISAEQVINLLNWAGFQVGVGGFRPEHSGNFGQYEVKH
jgi:hypothetical protein